MDKMELFKVCLGILAKGMLGVLIVAGVIILCIMLLNRMTKGSNKDENAR